MVAQQHRRRAYASPLRNRGNGRGREQRAARAAERAVGDDVDAARAAEVHNLLLRQARVVFDLIDGRDDGAACEQLLEVFLAVLFCTVSRRDMRGRELL